MTSARQLKGLGKIVLVGAGIAIYSNLADAAQKFYTLEQINALEKKGFITLENEDRSGDTQNYFLNGIDNKKQKKIDSFLERESKRGARRKASQEKREKRKETKKPNYSVNKSTPTAGVAQSTETAKWKIDGNAGISLFYDSEPNFSGTGLEADGRVSVQRKKILANAEANVQSGGGEIKYNGKTLAEINNALNYRVKASVLYNGYNKGNINMYAGLALDLGNKSSNVKLKDFPINTQNSDSFSGAGLGLCAKAQGYYINASLTGSNYLEIGKENIKLKYLPNLEGKLYWDERNYSGKESYLGIKGYTGKGNHRFSAAVETADRKGLKATKVNFGYNYRFRGAK